MTRRKDVQGTHWQGCEEEHHGCALDALRELRRKLHLSEQRLLNVAEDAERHAKYARAWSPE